MGKSNTNDFELDSSCANLIKGSDASCLYDKRCYTGITASTSEEIGDHHINFLSAVSNSDTNFKFHSIKDKCWIEPFNVIKVLSSPTLVPATSIV